jgi:hypothetical protein
MMHGEGVFENYTAGVLSMRTFVPMNCVIAGNLRYLFSVWRQTITRYGGAACADTFPTHARRRPAQSCSRKAKSIGLDGSNIANATACLSTFADFSDDC